MKRYLAPFAIATFLIVAFLGSISRSASATGEYSVTDLGVLGNCNGCNSLSRARAINASGLIVGEATTASAQTHAFLWQNGAMQDLGVLPGGSGSSARGVNSAGGVVGSSNGSTFGNHAFLWQNGAMQDLGTLPSGSGSVANGINDVGQIVGYSSTHGVIHAFVWQGGVFNDIAAAPGFGNCNSGANGINNLGQLVGTGCNAFLWSQTTGKQELGTLPGGAQSWANAINDQAQVAGESTVDNAGTRHAFLWQNGAMQDLGTLPGGTISRAWAINNLGDVAGEGTIAAGNFGHALLWRDGAVVDLNTLVPSGSGWELQIAYGINDGGQIVGEGMHNGARRAFLLMPSAPIATSTPSGTSTLQATNTASPEPPTFTLTPTATETETPFTATSSPTSTASSTATNSPTSTTTATEAATDTATATNSATVTASSTATTAVSSTPTPSLSPTVCSQPDPVQNGGFEQGFMSWVIDQQPPQPGVQSGGHSGNYAATVGSFPGDPRIPGDRFSSLYQQFNLPPAGGTLSFWYQLHASGQSGRQRIYLANTQGQPGAILLQQFSNTPEWRELRYTLGPSNGGAIRLYFEAFQHNDGSPFHEYATTGIKFDDVTFLPACGSPTSTATPTGTAAPGGTLTPTASPTPGNCGACNISIVILDGSCGGDQRFHWSALVRNSGVCSVPDYQLTLWLESRDQNSGWRVEQKQTITTTLAPGNNALQGDLCALYHSPFGRPTEMRVRMELDLRYWSCYQARTSAPAPACVRNSCP